MRMKGVITAGGLGTRLRPLTLATNKHLLPVYDRPMVFYPIQTLVKAGIDEILVVVGGPHAGDFLRVLKNGKELGVKHLEFAYQEGEGGIAEALSLAEDFADGGKLAVILGDNVTDADIGPAVSRFDTGAVVFAKQVADPKRYGVLVFDADGKTVVRVEEKPKEPKTNWVQTGLYLYDEKCFDYIRRLKPSARGELEVADLNTEYAREGQLKWEKLAGYWQDAGTFASLFAANKYWATKARSKI